MKRLRYSDFFKIVDYILPAVIVGSIIEFYLGAWSFDTILKLFSVIFSFFIVIKSQKANNGAFKQIFTFYIIYCIFTGLAYISNGKPFICYFSDISDFILPMLFVFIGLADNRTDRNLYEYFLNTLVVVLFIGLFFYLMNSSWYMARMAEIRNSEWYIDDAVYDENSIVAALRYCAFFKTSYPISHFATFGLAIALFDLLRKDQQINYVIPKIIVLIVSIVLCQHRVALACGTLFLVFIIYIAFFHKELHKVRPLIILSVIVLLVVAIVGITNNRVEDLYDMLVNRYEDMSVGNALKERKQIAEVFASWNNVLTGEGIGAGGAAARMSGFYGITDQNYAKLLYETGIVGCIIYIGIVLSTALRALKYYRYYLTELLILFFISIAMLGSNSLVIYYMYIILFWYAVGRVWNKKYLLLAKQTNIRI